MAPAVGHRRLWTAQQPTRQLSCWIGPLSNESLFRTVPVTTHPQSVPLQALRQMVPAFTPADVEQWLKPARANLLLPALNVMHPQWARFIGCVPDYIERFSVVESTTLNDDAARNGVEDAMQR